MSDCCSKSAETDQSDGPRASHDAAPVFGMDNAHFPHWTLARQVRLREYDLTSASIVHFRSAALDEAAGVKVIELHR